MAESAKSIKSAVAGGTISAHHFVTFNASGLLIQCSSAGEAVAGVAKSDAVSGDALAYWPVGAKAKVLTGGVITPGTDKYVQTDASGVAVKASAADAGKNIAGTPAFNDSQVATASGDMLDIEVGAGLIGAAAPTVRNVTVTFGAEAANVISMSFLLSDGDGNFVAEAQDIMFTIYDNNNVAALAAAFTATVTTGTAQTADVQPSMIVTTNVGGTAILDVTDVVGGSGAVLTVVAQVVDFNGAQHICGVPSYNQLTFDGV